MTDCSIKTHEAEETLDFEFYGTNVVNKIIMKVLDEREFLLLCIYCCIQAECLRETFNDLDMTSEVLKILVSSDTPYLQLSTFGHNGSTYVCLVVIDVWSKCVWL